MADQHDFSGLSEGERLLVEAAMAGENALLQDAHEIPAGLIVALACGLPFGGRDRPFPLARPRLYVQGGKVLGKLDFACRVVPVSLTLREMAIPDGIDLALAETRDIDIDQSTTGPVSARGAIVRGWFSAMGARLTRLEGGDGFALSAPDAEIRGDLFLRQATLKGGCNIAGASIGGQFAADDETTLFDNPGGDAINAQGAEIKADLFLSQATLKGCCDLAGASIGGQFSAVGEKTLFDNPGGKAINAQGAGIKEGVFLSQATLNGCCAINSAQIGGQFFASGETTLFDNPGGKAINAQRAEIKGGVFLDQATLKGNCYFLGASIEAKVDLQTANLLCGSACGPKINGAYALDLDGAQIAYLVMPMKHAPQGIVDLSNAQIGLLEDFKTGWPQRKAGTGRVANYLILDGLTYDRLARPDGEHESGKETGQSGGIWTRIGAWIRARLRALLPFLRRKPGTIESNRVRWLMSQPPEHVRTHFRPQPWRQLALTLARQGYEDEARRIAVQRRVRTRHAGGMGTWRRTVNWLLQALADYGFNPWKTVGWSALFVFAFAGINWGAAHWGCDGDTGCANQAVYVRTQPADFVPAAILETDVAEAQLRTVYPAFNPWLYSLDSFVPLFDLGMERYWRARDSYSVSLPSPLTFTYGEGRTVTLSGIPVGHLLIWLYVAQKFLGAILIALIVTGFTGLLSREEKV